MMNRRDFLSLIGLAAGATVLPSAIAGYVPGSVCTPDNPWLQHKQIEAGYSKLRIEIINTLRPLYSWSQPDFPVDFISNRRILCEFDVPPSACAAYELGQPVSKDVWPYINGLWPTEVNLEMSKEWRSATIKAELFEPGDGIDLSIIERVMQGSRS